MAEVSQETGSDISKTLPPCQSVLEEVELIDTEKVFIGRNEETWLISPPNERLASVSPLSNGSAVVGVVSSIPDEVTSSLTPVCPRRNSSSARARVIAAIASSSSAGLSPEVSSYLAGLTSTPVAKRELDISGRCPVSKSPSETSFLPRPSTSPSSFPPPPTCNLSNYSACDLTDNCKLIDSHLLLTDEDVSAVLTTSSSASNQNSGCRPEGTANVTYDRGHAPLNSTYNMGVSSNGSILKNNNNNNNNNCNQTFDLGGTFTKKTKADSFGGAGDGTIVLNVRSASSTCERDLQDVQHIAKLQELSLKEAVDQSLPPTTSSAPLHLRSATMSPSSEHSPLTEELSDGCGGISEVQSCATGGLTSDCPSEEGSANSNSLQVDPALFVGQNISPQHHDIGQHQFTNKYSGSQDSLPDSPYSSRQSLDSQPSSQCQQGGRLGRSMPNLNKIRGRGTGARGSPTTTVPVAPNCVPSAAPTTTRTRNSVTTQTRYGLSRLQVHRRDDPTYPSIPGVVSNTSNHEPQLTTTNMTNHYPPSRCSLVGYSSSGPRFAPPQAPCARKLSRLRQPRATAPAAIGKNFQPSTFGGIGASGTSRIARPMNSGIPRPGVTGISRLPAPINTSGIPYPGRGRSNPSSRASSAGPRGGTSVQQKRISSVGHFDDDVDL